MRGDFCRDPEAQIDGIIINCTTFIKAIYCKCNSNLSSEVSYLLTKNVITFKEGSNFHERRLSPRPYY